MNASQTLQADVLIVGAGPVGLMLANLLGLHGVPTLVIERNARTVAEPRAVSLDDESLRTLQSAGLAEAVIKDIVLGYGVQYFSWRGRPFASIQPTRQEFGYPKRNAFRQPLLEQTLRDGLRRFAHVRVLFEHELQGFEQRDAHVASTVHGPAGPIDARSGWLIGCDGGRSDVRERCGIRLEGTTHAERWLIVDLAGRTTPLRHTQTFCDPLRPAIRLPGPQGTLRYEFMLRAGEDDAFALDEARFRGWMADRCPADRHLPLVRKVVYTFHARVADRWRHDRVLLAGDAAHLTPPFAGQGMNSGIRDAANLAWKLAAVTRRGAPESLLDSYEVERRPHAEAIIRMALRIGRFMQPKTRAGAAVMQGALRLACLLPAARDYVLQLRFKPKPRLHAGFVEPSASGERRSDLLPQPMMDLPDRSVRRLDDLLGSGFAVVGWDGPALRAVAAGDPSLRVVALTRAQDDFIARDPPPAAGALTEARDGSGMLDRLLDKLGAEALVLRPDRYVWRVIARGGWQMPQALHPPWSVPARERPAADLHSAAADASRGADPSGRREPHPVVPTPEIHP